MPTNTPMASQSQPGIPLRALPAPVCSSAAAIGGCCAEGFREPTGSTTLVTSGAAAGGFDGALLATGLGGALTVSTGAPDRSCPQERQKRAPGVTSLPQAGQNSLADAVLAALLLTGLLRSDGCAAAIGGTVPDAAVG